MSKTVGVFACIKAVLPKCLGSHCNLYRAFEIFIKPELLKNILGKAIKLLILKVLML